MKSAIIIVILTLCLVGCKASDDSNNTTLGNNSPAAMNAPSASNLPGNESTTGSGVAPMATGAGGMTPMSGTESIQGASGGGVGQAAKQMAKDKTANMGGGTLNQGEKDDSGQ